MADVVTVKEGETLLFGGRRQKLRFLRSRKVHAEEARSLFVLLQEQHQKKKIDWMEESRRRMWGVACLFLKIWTLYTKSDSNLAMPGFI